MLDPILKAELERDEGRRLKAYLDKNNYWTIGVGHLLGSSPRMSSITDAECDALLSLDIDIALSALCTVFGQQYFLASPAATLVDDVRYRALINMAFNRGVGHMQKSTTITPAIKMALGTDLGKDLAWKRVAGAIRESPWAKQIGARAERLAVMLEPGQ